MMNRVDYFSQLFLLLYLWLSDYFKILEAVFDCQQSLLQLQLSWCSKNAILIWGIGNFTNSGLGIGIFIIKTHAILPNLVNSSMGIQLDTHMMVEHQ